MRAAAGTFFAMIFAAAILVVCTPRVAAVYGQAPVATLTGSVTDLSGAVIPGAQISVKQIGTGFSRKLTSQSDGSFEVENLQPGDYEIEASSGGFATAWRRLVLHVGDTVTIRFELQPGLLNERVEVRTDALRINSTEVGISGVVNRTQIENLPLNGRNYLELAQLEPAVSSESVSNPGLRANNYTRVNIAGASHVQTRVFIDGATVGDRFVGGTTQNFSQESLQEFQISTFSFDPATGTTAAGAINVVSRRGGNDLHGSAFFYYRDHRVAAYPGLGRDSRNPDPFFARRQPGFSLGGPLKRDRLFWFANYEHNNQDGAFAITNNHPIFSKLDVIAATQLDSHLANARLDWSVSKRHQAFLRFSVDMNRNVAPAAVVGMPSNWYSSRNRAIQIQGGILSVLSQSLVNDLRYSYGYFGAHLNPVSPAECRDPVGCIGVGGANILVFDAPQFLIGNQVNSPMTRWQRTSQLTDNLTWQHAEHRLRFGGEWEHLYWKAAGLSTNPRKSSSGVRLICRRPHSDHFTTHCLQA